MSSKMITSQFIDPAGTYSNYTSEVLINNDDSTTSAAGNLEGLIQIAVTGAASVTVQSRISEDAPWIATDNFSASMINMIRLAPFMRVVVTGSARVWVGELRG